jgi:hypothetical protein
MITLLVLDPEADPVNKADTLRAVWVCEEVVLVKDGVIFTPVSLVNGIDPE